MYNNDELYHFGVKGMRWGHRKSDYHSTGIRSAIAKKQNDKVDKSFKDWNANAKKKQDAIALGKKLNISKMQYETNRSDKGAKSQYKSDKKAYKKAFKGNTTYRKGQIRKEVGSDLSRKYLSEAKRIKKQMNADPSNKQLQKRYNDLMSKHDVERAKARKAPSVAEKRSRKKASIKRGMTMTVKAACTATAVTAGAYAVNRYLENHNVTLNGQKVNFSSQKLSNVVDAAKKVKNMFGYMY